MKCPHGGTISTVASANTSVQAGGQPLLLVPDRFVVSGCPNLPPCVTVNWQTGTTRVKIGSNSVLFLGSQGKCTDGNGSPDGAPLIITSQTVVKGD